MPNPMGFPFYPINLGELRRVCLVILIYRPSSCKVTTRFLVRFQLRPWFYGVEDIHAPVAKNTCYAAGTHQRPARPGSLSEFVALYGPCIFDFTPRRLPQDEDAADVVSGSAVRRARGSYQRPKGRFQKSAADGPSGTRSVIFMRAARARRTQVVADASNALRRMRRPRAGEEWEMDRRRHLFHAAANHVRAKQRTVLDSLQCARPWKIRPARKWPARSNCP